MPPGAIEAVNKNPGKVSTKLLKAKCGLVWENKASDTENTWEFPPSPWYSSTDNRPQQVLTRMIGRRVRISRKSPSLQSPQIVGQQPLWERHEALPGSVCSTSLLQNESIKLRGKGQQTVGTGIVMKTHCGWERKQKKNFYLEEVPEYILDPDQ